MQSPLSRDQPCDDRRGASIHSPTVRTSEGILLGGVFLITETASSGFLTLEIRSGKAGRRSPSSLTREAGVAGATESPMPSSRPSLVFEYVSLLMCEGFEHQWVLLEGRYRPGRPNCQRSWQGPKRSRPFHCTPRVIASMTKPSGVQW